MKRAEKDVYLNSKQLEFLSARQKTKVFLGGRGIGKSVGIGANTYMKASVMPRARSLFASTTYRQILTSTLPAIESKFVEMKLQPYDPITKLGHYVVGQKPPPHWPRCYNGARKYDNTLTIMNGYMVQFLSMDRMDLARGGSYDSADIDEAALVKREAFSKVMMPSVRGNRHRFTHWMHHQIALYTSIPWKPSGYWILEYEDKAKADPDKYFFLEGNAYDNIDVLGEEGIQRMKDEMTHLEFQVEVMNMRIRKIEGGFYYKFNEELHTYEPKWTYGDSENGITLTGRNDYDTGGIIDATFDFSGWFNCMICMQSTEVNARIHERAIDVLWVKDNDKIDELIDKFAGAYEKHRFKYIRIWGEPRGHDKNPHGETLYEKIRKRLERYGWQVEICVTPHRTNLHAERFQYMNDILGEEDGSLPVLRVNYVDCKDLILALMTTEVDSNFQKDKSKEKDRAFPQEHAPHLPDALDYYFIQKHGWRVAMDKVGSGEFHFS